MFKVLLAEDNVRLRNIIKTYLEKHNFEVFAAFDGKHAYEIFEGNHIDIIISDVMMPYVDGNTLVKRIRVENEHIPIIMLTALESYRDKEKSFNSGADDYMVKPVDMKELVLRIKVLLKRFSITSDLKIELKDISLDFSTKTCKLAKQDVLMTLKEFDLLYKLLSSPNRIFTRRQLLDEIWGFESESYERTVDTHIKRLREKINSQSFEIITVRGLGYKAVIK